MEEEIIPKVISNKEFLTRTIALVKKYEGKLDATLFMNACVGLLFIATEKYGNEIKKLDSSNYFDKVIDVNKIQVCRKYVKSKRSFENEEANLFNVCKHFRNSIAHCNFELKKGSDGLVGTVLFQDFYDRVTPRTKKDKMTFAYELPMVDFKAFILGIAKTFSKK